MEPMTLREAAQRTARSITTLRRYIRSGRLRAEKRPGRFGPEYFIAEEALSEAGLHAVAGDRDAAVVRHADSAVLPRPLLEQVLSGTVPLSLYQELQMKHEQLLVQYGMVRAAGMRLFELQADLSTRQRDLEQSRAELGRVRGRLDDETARLEQQLRQAQLEEEGRSLEIAALREKVHALEMLTRNLATSETIEKQFSDVMAQSRRVDRLASRRTDDPRPVERPSPPEGRDH